MSTDLARRHTSNDVPSTGVSEAITQALDGLRAIRTFIKAEFKEGRDYGKIPGCGDKNTLYLAGAQKATMYFNSYPTYKVQEKDLGVGHVEFRVRCLLMSRVTGQQIGEGVGCASTKEKKFRRGAAKPCPSCGNPTIMRSREEYGGGWYCNTKAGGCGAKFAKGHKGLSEAREIESEDSNFEQHNTVLKMAKKRAHVDSAITLGCLSELFTQDIEDTYPMVEVRESARQEEPEPHHIDGEIIEPPKPAQKFASNDSGHGRTGVYGSPAQVAAMASDVTKQYDRTGEKWVDCWTVCNREMPPGLPAHPIPKPMLYNHLLKLAIREGRLKELPETFDPESGERIAKVSVEETKKLVAVVHARDKKWILDEVWFYFWEKAAEVARDFFDDNPNWMVPPEFDSPKADEPENVNTDDMDEATAAANGLGENG